MSSPLELLAAQRVLAAWRQARAGAHQVFLGRRDDVAVSVEAVPDELVKAGGHGFQGHLEQSNFVTFFGCHLLFKSFCC